MKKIFTLLLALAMIFSIAACSQSSAPASNPTTPSTPSTPASPSTPSDTPDSASGSYNIGGGASGGVYYAMGTTFSQFFNDMGDLGTFNPYTSSGTGQNLMFMKNGDIQFGIVAASIGADAYNGQNDWAGDKQYKDLRGVAFLYPIAAHMLVTPESGIKSMGDIKGKRIAVGAPGGGDQFIMKMLLEPTGLTFDDFKPEYVSFSDALELLKDGHIDGLPVFANLPYSGILEVINSGKATVVGVDESTIAPLTEGDDSLFFKLTAPANAYPKQEQAFDTVGFGTVLCADASVSDEQVYAMVKAIYENLPDLTARHAAIANLSADQCSMIKGFPLHPGAEKYYKEIGVLK